VGIDRERPAWRDGHDLGAGGPVGTRPTIRSGRHRRRRSARAADSRRIYQVIQDLLTNAVKYSPDGGTISLAGRQERHDLMVSVQDQGLGMPANELDRIFDRFHRVSGDLARQKIGGTGLGLAICKGLVDAHGGRIWAESEGDSKGSVFKFTLPLLPEMQEVSGSKGVDDHQKANRTRR
jgi:signal transduction histidine kinase